MHVLHKLTDSTCSLKRTTDVMFGGKQVVVCGYGEVERTFLSRSLYELVLYSHMGNILSSYGDIFLSHSGGERLLRRPQSDGLHRLRDRDRPHLCLAGLVRLSFCWRPGCWTVL